MLVCAMLYMCSMTNAVCYMQCIGRGAILDILHKNGLQRLHEQLQVTSGVFKPHVYIKSVILTSLPLLQLCNGMTSTPFCQGIAPTKMNISPSRKTTNNFIMSKTIHILSNISHLSKCVVQLFPRHQSHTTI